MNRTESLRALLNHAQSNGFEFRSWFEFNVRPAWPGAEPALELLAVEGRFYSLLFSHEFARCFWCSGAEMSFAVPSVSYARVTARGDVIHVTRKPFTRRIVKRDVWKYHLRQMAASDDPIGYLQRFLPSSFELAMGEPELEAVGA